MRRLFATGSGNCAWLDSGLSTSEASRSALSLREGAIMVEWRREVVNGGAFSRRCRGDRSQLFSPPAGIQPRTSPARPARARDTRASSALTDYRLTEVNIDPSARCTNHSNS